MKIKTADKDYRQVMLMERPAHHRPGKPSFLMQTIIRIASAIDLTQTRFVYEKINMDRAGKGPWLVLMNHSSFLDFEIATKILWPRPFNIVATSDGFVGRKWFMKSMGCIPTCKFIPDPHLISDITYALKTNHCNLLMYPEASYSFNGTTAPLPPGFSRLLKILDVPVVMITAYGSFTRDPLYNNLQNRKVRASAKVECLLTPDEIRQKSLEQLDGIVNKAFSLDYFRWQFENRVATSEPFRADGLDRILFRCTECGSEGQMSGHGTELVCNACGRHFFMDEYGSLHGGSYSHIPDWYKWEREQIRGEIADGTYCVETRVRIAMMVDMKAIYFVCNGTLRHDTSGFELTGDDGILHFIQNPNKCYSVYSDFNWYELGDIVCIGEYGKLYYCFPETPDLVAKVRIAAEELYRLNNRKNLMQSTR